MGDTTDKLPAAKEVLAVCAHPDDEAFGLGAVLRAFVEQGSRIRTLCFTHGEASTLGAAAAEDLLRPPLGEIRAKELSAAAKVLGVDHVELLGYPDGQLDRVPLEVLARLVGQEAASAELLLVFDEGGITGHPDHRHATAAALKAAQARGLSVLAWTLPEPVASELNAEYATSFQGRPAQGVDIVIEVDRTRQLEAVACHASQLGNNPVLWRRLELLGSHEHLHWLLRDQPHQR